MFSTSTKAISTNAAAQPRACSAGSGDSENAKIATGSVGSAWETSPEIALAAIDEVKSKRRGLSGDPRNGDDDTRENPADCAREDDAPDRSPLVDAERKACLALAAGNDLEHLLRRACDHREHQDRKRDGAEDRALAMPDDQQAEDEDSDDDRGDPVEYVEDDAEAA